MEVLGELGLLQDAPTTVWCDNTGAVALANDAASLGRSKHIARRARFLLEAGGSGAIRLRSIAGSAQAADVLTKPLERKRFVALVEHMLNSANAVSGDVSPESEKDELRRAAP